MSNPWLVPLLASMIGGAFVLAGVSVTHYFERKTQEEKEKRVVRAFLQGLLVEVESLWQRYQDTMGPQVETLKDGEPLLHYYPVYQDYFSVYHGTSALIGLIEDDDLRTLIVTTYIKTKGLGSGLITSSKRLRRDTRLRGNFGRVGRNGLRSYGSL